MNFLGHAIVASRERTEPAFVLGAMLPDLVSMAGVRLATVSRADVAAGVALHHATDAVFHAAPTFVSIVVEAGRWLAEGGMRRGPARGVAHIGTELLLDGVEVRCHGVPAAYDQALLEAPKIEPHCAFRGRERPAEAEILSRTCARITDLELAAGYRDPDFVAERLVHILSRRPRLALEPAEIRLLGDWAEEFDARIETASAQLWNEVWSGLDPAAWYPRAR
ncbi:MAG: hypothetical protein JRH01_13320 [Deltaproteobacteria bacterium]|nr:hypothetical protein [Deltaproteobacteria bacterium]MBW2393706.1 hypothetical protein [Deltaproteobacteria bacterium]